MQKNNFNKYIKIKSIKMKKILYFLFVEEINNFIQERYRMLFIVLFDR